MKYLFKCVVDSFLFNFPEFFYIMLNYCHVHTLNRLKLTVVNIIYIYIFFKAHQKQIYYLQSCVLQGVVEYYVKNSEQLCLFEVKPFQLKLYCHY